MFDVRWLKSLYRNQLRGVTRTGVAADCATQHAFNVFQINGENVIVSIIGKVVADKAVGAQTLEIGFTPTGGARTIIAIASATTASDVANKYYTWDGVLGTAVIVAQTGDVIGVGAAGSALAGTSKAQNIFCPGIIDITTAAANDLTGLINWTVLYKPMSINSSVTAL